MQKCAGAGVQVVGKWLGCFKSELLKCIKNPIL